MKKFLYVGAMLTFVGSVSITGYQHTQAAGSQASLIPVRLCSSGPVGIGGDKHLTQGIYHGVSVATASWRGKFKAAGLKLLAPLNLDDAKSDGSAVDPAKEASNARQCLADPADMGYIGTLNSSMAQVSEPINNRGGLGMISPSNTNPILTNPALRGTYEPATASGKLKYPTYYRMVTTDALQGPIGAIYMKQLGFTKFYLVDDQQTYGAGLALHMTAYATSHLGMTQAGSGHLDTSSTAATATSAAAQARLVVAASPQAIYCGCDLPYAGPMLKAARRAGYKGAFFGGDAINDVTFPTFAGGVSNVYSTYSTTVGNPNATPKSFKKLEDKFYPGWTAGPYDGFAYDASNVLLQSILASKTAGTLKGSNFQRRSSILKYIAKGKFVGTVGPFHFDKNGDISLKVLSVWTWQGSNWSLLKVFTTSNTSALRIIKPTP